MISAHFARKAARILLGKNSTKKAKEEKSKGFEMSAGHGVNIKMEINSTDDGVNTVKVDGAMSEKVASGSKLDSPGPECSHTNTYRYRDDYEAGEEYSSEDDDSEGGHAFLPHSRSAKNYQSQLRQQQNRRTPQWPTPQRQMLRSNSLQQKAIEWPNAQNVVARNTKQQKIARIVSEEEPSRNYNNWQSVKSNTYAQRQILRYEEHGAARMDECRQRNYMCDECLSLYERLRDMKNNIKCHLNEVHDGHKSIFNANWLANDRYCS